MMDAKAKSYFWPKVDKRGPDECWEWLAYIHRDGYGVFCLPRSSCENENRARRAHRASWEIANGPIPDGMIVCHRCDNPRCVNPGHLFLGTYQDNSRDRDAKGRGADRRGEKHPQVKLTEQQVRDIRANAALCRVTHSEIASWYGVSRSAVASIITRRAWAHI